MIDHPSTPTDPIRQRARVKRTVLVLAVVSAGLYVAFILRAVLHG